MADTARKLSESEQLRRSAQTAYKSGDLDRSARTFALLVESTDVAIDPATRANDNLDYGTVLIRLGRQNEALGFLRRASELAPTDPRILLKLGQMLSRLERRDEAVEAFQALAAAAPNDPDAHSALAAELRLLGRIDEARAAAERALELDHEHIDARLTLMAIEAHQGTRTEKAIDEALAMSGGDVRLLYLREEKPPALWWLALQAVVLALAALWLRSLFP
jgi:Flp pilus assembly protein TadD